ncbi:MAG: hypothetical protein K8M05_25390 [Deltaproteobacteria bacterium]|nr:hypothetical protein [Kofleriaceae bacterium]
MSLIRPSVIVLGDVSSAAWMAAELRTHGLWTWTVTGPAELAWVTENLARPAVAVADLRMRTVHRQTIEQLLAKITAEGTPAIVLGEPSQEVRWLRSVVTVLGAGSILSDVVAAIHDLTSAAIRSKAHNNGVAASSDGVV